MAAALDIQGDDDSVYELGIIEETLNDYPLQHHDETGPTSS